MTSDVAEAVAVLVAARDELVAHGHDVRARIGVLDRGIEVLRNHLGPAAAPADHDDVLEGLARMGRQQRPGTLGPRIGRDPAMVQVALRQLDERGLVSRSGPGWYQLTAAGRAHLEALGRITPPPERPRAEPVQPKVPEVSKRRVREALVELMADGRARTVDEMARGVNASPDEVRANLARADLIRGGGSNTGYWRTRPRGGGVDLSGVPMTRGPVDVDKARARAAEGLISHARD